MIHPSLILKASLDERQAAAGVVDDIKRSYSYVGPISVARHAAADPACNTMRLIVRMSKPYWRSTDPDGDAMWAAVADWLKGKLYKVGSTMENYNKTHRKAGQPTVEYGRLEIETKEVAFGFALPAGDLLPAVDAQVARYRELLNAGLFDGMEVASVEAPSKESYAAQLAAARTAAMPEGGDADGQGAGEDGAQAAEGGAAGEEVPAGQAAEDGAVQAGPAGETAPAAAPGLAEVDYRIWDVALADGTVRVLDSVAGTWL